MNANIQKNKNQGAALLMVILITSFMITLGSSLLFTSYNGYLMKIVDRHGVDSFYSNEEALELVRAGLQEAANISLIEAHEQVTAEYRSIVNEYGSDIDRITEETQLRFAQYYLQGLGDWKTPQGNNLFDFTAANDKYYVLDGIEDLLLGAFKDATLSVGEFGEKDLGGNLVPRVLTETRTPIVLGMDPIVVNITLKDLLISHEKNGYLNNITTDITLNVPIYVKGSTSGGGYPFGNSSIIARGAVKLGDNSYGGQVDIKGDFYGGTIEIGTKDIVPGTSINGTAVTVKHSGGSWITGYEMGATAEGELPIQGLVVYDGDQSLEQSADSELWASEVSVGLASNISLLGNSYVMQDLTVEGGNSSYTSEIILAGNYFGFGSGETATSSLQSSAIVFNGANVELNITGLESLKLAGSAAVIETTTHTKPNNITGGQYTWEERAGAELVIGQSMATAPDQIAYLVPNGAMPEGTTNPMLWPPDSKVEDMKNISIDASYELWNGKKISDYATATPYVMMKTLGSTTGFLVYAFLDFKEVGGTDREMRNAYFGDYITYNQTEFQSYLDRYLTIIGEDGFEAVTEGYTYFNAPAQGDSLTQLYAEASRVAKLYYNKRITLDEDLAPNPVLGSPDRPEQDPYHYYLRPPTGTIGVASNIIPQYDNTKLREEATKVAGYNISHTIEFENRNGQVLAIYTTNPQNFIGGSNGDEDLTQIYPHLKFVISGGTVNVITDFDGLIMSANDIAVTKPLVSNSAGIDDAMEATHENHAGETVKLKDYFQNLEESDYGGDGDGNMTWNLDDLVIYENWEKH